MDFQNLHVGSPQKKNHPYIDEWIEDAWGKITQINSGWKLRKFKYDEKNNFVPHDQFTAIKSLPGPVLLIEKVQRKSAKILADRINNKFPIDIVDIRSEDQLEKIMLQSIEQYKNYDPFLPRKYVVALLVINKLVQLNMWGGKNKGYLWYHDIPKGRGVPDKFKDVIGDVVNILKENEILISKTSQGKKKYAVNPENKELIHNILRSRSFEGRVRDLLLKDKRTASISYIEDAIKDNLNR